MIIKSYTKYYKFKKRKETNHFLIFSAAAISMILILSLGCKKEYSDIEEELIKLPTIDIVPATVNTAYSAKSGGNVMYDEGAPVAALGTVWSTSENPTIESNNGKTDDGEGTGEFYSSLTGLKPENTYYLKAYTTNSEGTAYSDYLEFTTKQKEFTEGIGTLMGLDFEVEE